MNDDPKNYRNYGNPNNFGVTQNVRTEIIIDGEYNTARNA